VLSGDVDVVQEASEILLRAGTSDLISRLHEQGAGPSPSIGPNRCSDQLRPPENPAAAARDEPHGGKRCTQPWVGAPRW